MSTATTTVVGIAPGTASKATTARQRLELSRSKLVRQMSGDSDRKRSRLEESEIRVDASGMQDQRTNAPLGTWALVKLGLGSWWRHHPANLAVTLGRPVLQRFAKRRPFQLLAASAGVGAVVVLIKPWRLVSLGGLAFATLKSSEFSGLVASLLSFNTDESDSAENPQDIS